MLITLPVLLVDPVPMYHFLGLVHFGGEGGGGFRAFRRVREGGFALLSGRVPLWWGGRSAAGAAWWGRGGLCWGGGGGALPSHWLRRPRTWRLSVSAHRVTLRRRSIVSTRMLRVAHRKIRARPFMHPHRVEIGQCGRFLLWVGPVPQVCRRIGPHGGWW